MWLGEQITERGIGQGISLIITVGIIAGLPGGVTNTAGRPLRGNTRACTSRNTDRTHYCSCYGHCLYHALCPEDSRTIR